MPSKASLSSTAPARGARGVRILALDGGGTRALLTIEMLKELERRAGRPVHELFDLVAGTSTGAILAAGIQARIPLDELEQLYLALAAQVFVDDGRFTKMARQLVTGAAYKAARLEAILAELLPSPVPDEGMRARWSRLAREPADDRAALPPPHLMIAACLVSRAPPVPFVFRDYEVSDEDDAEPVRRPAGTSAVPVQQALRATSAAPSYFPELVLSSLAANGEEAVPQEQQPPRQPPQPQPQQQRAPPPRAPPAVFQDGGLVANNPAALALREARALYPGEPIAALASFGTGAFAPSVASRPGSWAALAQTLVRAATRTEEVHQLLSDLLPRTATAYFRFNPAVPAFPLNETAPSRLRELQAIGRAAVRSEDGARALERLAGLLTPQAGASARAGGSAEAGGQPWAMWAWPAAALARLRALVGGGEAAPRSRL